MRKVGQEAYNLISQMASDMAALGPEGEIFAPALESLGALLKHYLTLVVLQKLFATIG